MADAPATPDTAAQTEDEIRRTVRDMVLQLAPAPDPGADGQSRLAEDLGFHSLALVELAFALEDDFDLPLIDEPAARRITTIDEVAAHVIRALSARGDLAG